MADETKPAKQDTANDVDLELKALDRCSKLLAPLPPEAASRVLLYLARRFDPPPANERARVAEFYTRREPNALAAANDRAVREAQLARAESGSEAE